MFLDSLVKGTKCLTPSSTSFIDSISADGVVSRSPTSSPVPFVDIPGTSVCLDYRSWSGTFRARCVAVTSVTGSPPVHAGPRYTSVLSARGAAALSDSCEFVDRVGVGFRTFITLTLDAEARARLVSRVPVSVGGVVDAFPGTGFRDAEPRYPILGTLPDSRFYYVVPFAAAFYCNVSFIRVFCGGVAADGPFCRIKWVYESSVQREVSRWCQSLRRMFSRGWVPAYSRRGVVSSPKSGDYCPIVWNSRRVRLPGCLPSDDDLPYCWVAEAPISADGLPNPHIHVLIGWAVPFEVFPCWAARIEKLWGQGFAHLEKLRDSASAGGYIAKAAGYLSKGSRSADQGIIRGNRYGIAKCARAPGFVQISRYHWGVFGACLSVAREHFLRSVLPLRWEVSSCLSRVAASPPVAAPVRRRLLRAVHATRKKLRSLPVVVGNFQVLFHGLDNVRAFFRWCISVGWSPSTPQPSPWFAEFLARLSSADSADLLEYQSSVPINAEQFACAAAN